METIQDYFTNFGWVQAIDMAGLVLGLIYLWLEFKASIWLWLVVDAVCTVLYIYKQIPFTACLYAFYTVMAVLGYRQWLKKIPATT